MKNNILKFLFLLFFSVTIQSYAHHPGNSLIYLKIYENQGIEGRFDVNVNDFNRVFGLNLSQSPSWEEVKPHFEKFKRYLYNNARFSSKYGNHDIVFSEEEYDAIWTTGGDFIKFPFHLENTSQLPDDLDVMFKAFIEEKPSHINLLGIEYNWKAGLINNELMISLDFTNDNWNKTLSLTDGSVWKGFIAMVKQGVWHIWIGLDHILFLVALILPSVVRRRKRNVGEKFSIWGWEPVMAFKPAFMYIIKIVTFFTIAHTITLSLSSLNIIVLPSRWVESIIAFSIGLAAYHNIKPIFKGKDWVIAFVFGLFHGFGFASVMGELGFKGEHLTTTLLGFNIGVEIGQLVIIAAIFPILYFIRKRKIYPKFLVYLSGMLILISLYWVVERAFDINLTLDDQLKTMIAKVLIWLGIW